MDSTLGPYFESYSEAGELTEKYVYDFNRERTVPVRLYKNTGVTVTDITSAEYVKLLADSCNMPLGYGSGAHMETRFTGRRIEKAANATFKLFE